MKNKKLSTGFTLPTHRLNDYATKNLFQEVEKQSIRIANNINTLETLLEATRKDYVQTINLTKILLNYGLKNDILQKRLNADMLDGYHADDFVYDEDYTAADVLAKLLTVDGPTSGLSVTQAANSALLNSHTEAQLDVADSNKLNGSLESELSVYNSSRLNGQLASYYAVRATEALYKVPSKVYKNATAQTLSNGGNTKISGWTTDFDDSSIWDNTHNRYNVTPGKYQVNCQVHVTSFSGTQAIPKIYVAGSEYQRESLRPNSGASTFCVEDVINITTNTYIEFYCAVYGGNAPIQTNNRRTHFNCWRIG